VSIFTSVSVTPVRELTEEDKSALELMAWNILKEVDEAVGVMDLAKERASCGGYNPPIFIGQYLMWIKDEAEMQEEIYGVSDEKDPGVEAYIRLLKDVVEELVGLGFRPADKPWEMK
jgi:hypothetical protein